MELIISLAMVGTILSFIALILRGGQFLASGAAGEGGDGPGRWPRVALIVPVTGSSPGLPARLASLLNQDYPDYQVIFVTRSPADPATPIILDSIRGHSRARHLISGPATTCGQKNHNLLAGVRALSEIPEVLAFCDSNQLAPPHWLAVLVRPIACGETDVTSGYHHVLPGDRKLATLGRTITVLCLYLMKGIPWLDQPWGGATAIKRTIFESLQVDRWWADKVVDDVSLAALLKKAGMSFKTVPAASLFTPLAAETLRGWEDWLTRQWLYLKFCLPGAWLAGGILLHCLIFLLSLAGFRVFASAVGWAPPGQSLAALGFLALVAGAGLALRTLHPAPAPWPAWLLAFFATLGMASWCHFRTWLSRIIHWRGISYRVTWRGKVVEIKESESR